MKEDISARANKMFEKEKRALLTQARHHPTKKRVISIIMMTDRQTVSKVNQLNHTCAIFLPHAATKFMQGTNKTLQAGLVDEDYYGGQCQYWLIPINWNGYNIPR